MADPKSQRFQVHVSKGGGNRGSKIATALFFLVVLGIGAAGYYFWAMQDKLVEHVRNRDGVAVAAAWAIYFKGEPPADAYEPLKAAVEHGEPGLRRAAVRTLGLYRKRELVAPMLDVLAKDSDPLVRAAAAACLGENGETTNPLLQNAIRDALEDPHSAVRAAAATTVGQLRYETLIPNLIGLLGDSENAVKKAAKHALETFTEGDLTYDFDRRQWGEWYDERSR